MTTSPSYIASQQGGCLDLAPEKQPTFKRRKGTFFGKDFVSQLFPLMQAGPARRRGALPDILVADRCVLAELQQNQQLKGLIVLDSRVKDCPELVRWAADSLHCKVLVVAEGELDPGQAQALLPNESTALLDHQSHSLILKQRRFSLQGKGQYDPVVCLRAIVQKIGMRWGKLDYVYSACPKDSPLADLTFGLICYTKCEYTDPEAQALREIFK